MRARASPVGLKGYRVLIDRQIRGLYRVHCYLEVPHEISASTFYTCCGKHVCDGCIYAMDTSEGGGDLCPFCRRPDPSIQEEYIGRLMKLIKSNHAKAFETLAGCYAQGIMGMPQDHQKSNELLLKAGELGYSASYFNLGMSYDIGEGVEVDKKKATYYYELAAIGGNVTARHRLGIKEVKEGNHERGCKSWGREMSKFH